MKINFKNIRKIKWEKQNEKVIRGKEKANNRAYFLYLFYFLYIYYTINPNY